MGVALYRIHVRVLHGVGSQAGRAQSRLRIWSGDTSTHYLLRWNAVVIIINRKWLLNMRVHGREITHTLCCRQWR